ncbi:MULTISPECIES: undecaprenyl-diphosphate phosphatase [Nostocales]|uniref:Undecaprenyl-diphosphate phosphatase n=1 Tax=Dolichospermum flos-aquae UHCC 0037 TaxID=2590026 RepID=A0ACC7S500_DOLFA|nr:MULTISPECIES: undecaprenyl-diphosphate phosphatase [Nostocales]MBO1064453.1 undecaprenyl-diphosphate phosphatase [Anabaena sp. 54]MCX5980465.1 undecaprenyl-diphosphate phosphatase [Nostocales cyanobacterium LacPavin_0920_SED1_MAG_38_18]MTJ43302.1 undecaprenyl-diphosphate phosphatase [Dolichospermum flos-aquae UHCC 0037]
MTTILEVNSINLLSWQLLQVGVPEGNLIQLIFQAFILGIVQGITEFLPISSTAHLEVFTKAFHWQELSSKAFLATIQFGSVIAVLIYFWTDIKQILTGGFKAFQQKDWEQEEWKLLVGIAIGTLPAVIGGFVLKKALNSEDSAINSMTSIAIVSIVMSLLLGASEKLGSHKRDFSTLTIRDGLLIGIGQMMALAPGASRSGSTLTTALFLGLERQTAARFSFLLGIPTLTLATVYQFLKEALGKIDLVVVGVGTLSAFVFSYISIAWLLRYLQTKNTWIFVWYRLAFGATILSAIAAGMLKNS